MMRAGTIFALLALTAAPGCGPRVTAPSLAPRAVEKQAIELPETIAAEAPGAADPLLASRIAPIVTGAEEGDRAFGAVERRTRAMVAAAAGAPRDGEAWTVAQQALSTLQVAQGPVHDAATAMEDLRHDPAYAAAADRALIDAAAARIEALESEEAAALAMLAARLS